MTFLVGLRLCTQVPCIPQRDSTSHSKRRHTQGCHHPASWHTGDTARDAGNKRGHITLPQSISLIWWKCWSNPVSDIQTHLQMMASEGSIWYHSARSLICQQRAQRNLLSQPLLPHQSFGDFLLETPQLPAQTPLQGHWDWDGPNLLPVFPTGISWHMSGVTFPIVKDCPKIMN